MGLDLAHEQHRAVGFDTEIGGFAGVFHQLPQDRPGALDKAGAAQIAGADDEGAGSDMPKLRFGIEFHQAAPFQRHENAIDRRRGLAHIFGDAAKGQPLRGAEKLEHLHRAVERFDDVLIALILPSARPATRSARGVPIIVLRFHQNSFILSENTIHDMKNIRH